MYLGRARQSNLILYGSIFWVIGIQYFVSQLIVASRWDAGFSLRNNTISDLGNTVCDIYGGRFVCSPLHQWMNASFILLGVTMIIGAYLLGRAFYRERLVMIGCICMAIAGIGTIIVGLFPENSISYMHVLGAGLPFVIGNIGPILVSTSDKLPRVIRYLSLLVGILGLVSLILFMTHNYFDLGNGGMERLTAYPQTLWMIILGLYLLFRYKN